MASPEHNAKVWNVIKAIKLGMLTTEVSGSRHARLMQIVQHEYDGTMKSLTRFANCIDR